MDAFELRVCRCNKLSKSFSVLKANYESITVENGYILLWPNIK